MKRDLAAFTHPIVVTGLILAFISCTGEESSSLIAEGAEPEIVSTGHQFTEGPYWHPEGYLLFSDIRANRIYRWVPGVESEVFVEPSGNSNGIAPDISGSLVVAQHQGKISRLTATGELETIVDQYEGNRLNSPNDLTVHSNRTIYFTDPPFGVEDEDRELEFSGVYSYSPQGELTLFYDEFELPNGVVLSPDESRLYVNDTATGNITVFDVNGQGEVSNAREFASVGPSSASGAADGMVVDTEGRLYTTGPAGISVFDSEGNHVQDLNFPQRVTNMDWGGPENNILYVTSVDKVYRLQTSVTGHKRR